MSTLHQRVTRKKMPFEIDMDEFGVDKDVIRTSSTRSIRWRHQNLVLETNLWNWVRVKDSKTWFLVGLRILISVDSLKFHLSTKCHCQVHWFRIKICSKIVVSFPNQSLPPSSTRPIWNITFRLPDSLCEFVGLNNSPNVHRPCLSS